MPDANTDIFKLFEFAMTSPYMTAGLGLLGLWLFILITREFTVWYLKIQTLHSKMDYLKETVIRMEADLEKLSDRLAQKNMGEPSKNVFPDKINGTKDPVQFPIEH